MTDPAAAIREALGLRYELDADADVVAAVEAIERATEALRYIVRGTAPGIKGDTRETLHEVASRALRELNGHLGPLPDPVRRRGKRAKETEQSAP